MNKILSSIKKYSAMAIAALCICAVPFAAACAKDDSGVLDNNTGITDNITTPENPDTAPGTDITEDPGDATLPDDGYVPDDNDNNVDLDHNGNPILPEPELPGEIQSPFAGSLSAPNTKTKYDKNTDGSYVNDWSLMELGGRYQDKIGDIYTGIWKNDAWTPEMIEEGWREAVIQSIVTTSTVTVKLNCNWIAQEDFSLGTSFGSGAGFGDYNTYAYGPIKVPVGASIILDLNGYKIDRALSEKATVSSLGMVIMVNGSLQITDSNTTKSNTFINPNTWVNFEQSGNTKNGSASISGGLITGGMNLYGGGVYVGQLSSAYCEIVGGSIAGNYATNGGATGINNGGRGGGVYVTDNASFVMYGGKVQYNTAYNGGGIYVPSNGNFSLEGGEIAHNVVVTKTSSAANGGGVYMAKTWEMHAGTITDNYAVSGNTYINSVCAGSSYSYGGGVYVAGAFTMNGGTISSSVAIRGAGLYVTGNMLMNDGLITKNYGKWYFATSWTTGGCIQINGTFYFNGGTISDNDTTFQSKIWGGPLNAGSLVMTGGKYTGNKTNGSFGNMTYSPYLCYVLGGEISNNTGGSCLFFVCASGGRTAMLVLKNVLIKGNTSPYIARTYNYADSPCVVDIADNARIVNNTCSGAVFYGVYNTASITIKDCEIINNTSPYGVYNDAGKTYIEGAPQIYGNHASGSTNEVNVRVANGGNNPLYITGPLSSNGKRAHIGITLTQYNTSSYPITSGYGAKVGDANTYNYFYIDDSSYHSTRYYNGEVYYNNANKPGSINAWKVKEGSGSFTTVSYSGNMGASSYTKTYDGKAVQVTNGSSAMNMTSSSNGTTGTDCLNAGTYVFTNGAGNSYKNPTFTVTILPAVIPVTGEPKAISRYYAAGDTSAEIDTSAMSFTNPSGLNLKLVGTGTFAQSTVGNNIRVDTYLTFVNQDGSPSNYVPDRNGFFCYANIMAVPSTETPYVTGITAAYNNRYTLAPNCTDATIKNQLAVVAHYSNGNAVTLNSSAYTLSTNRNGGNCTMYAYYQGLTSNAFTVPFVAKEVDYLTTTSRQGSTTIYYVNWGVASYDYMSVYYHYKDGSGTHGVGSSESDRKVHSYTQTDLFGQPCGDVVFKYTYGGFEGTGTLNITPAKISTVNVTFTQPDAPIFKTQPTSDLTQYITVTYVRNDGVQGSYTSSNYEIIGSLAAGGNVTLQLRVKSEKTSSGYAYIDTPFTVKVASQEVLAVGARYTQNSVVYAGYPLTVLPTNAVVKALYNTDITEAILGAAQAGLTYAQYNAMSQAEKNVIHNIIIEQRWNSLTTITDYTLKGKLEVGRPYVTVVYAGKTCEFQVEVSPVAFTYFAASFVQGNLQVLDTMSLDVLKNNLTIHTISNNGVAGTTKEYVLSYAGYFKDGVLVPGSTPDDPSRSFQRNATNLILASYINDSRVATTFRVNVSEVYLQRIEAVWSQPAAPIYAGTNINTLKSNLKVTAIMVGADNRVLGANDYALTGSVVDGQPIITVTYAGIITTFRPTITPVRVVSIAATYNQGGNAVYTSTPESTIKNYLRVVATYNNGTTKVLENNLFKPTYTLIAGAGTDDSKFVPACDILVTYLGIDYATAEPPSCLLEKQIVVQEAVLVRLMAKLDAKVWQVADNTIFETTTKEETAKQLARVPSMLNPSGVVGLKVTPYYSKNGKLSGAYAGDLLTADDYAKGTYTMTIDPKMNSNLLKAGANEIVVSYGGYTASITVQVTKVALSGISATGNFPTDNSGKSILYASTPLETIKSYITVKASYNNGASKGVDSFRLEAPAGTVSHTNNEFTVYYSEDGVEKSCKIAVPIAESVLESISAVYKQGSDTVYTDADLQMIGASVGTGTLEVKAYYNDNKEGRDITSSEYTISGNLAAGVCTLTVNYNGKTATFTVNVVEAQVVQLNIVSFNTNQKIYATTPLNTLKDLLVVSGTTNSNKTVDILPEDYTVTGNLSAQYDETGSVTQEPYITLVYNKNNAVTVTRNVTVESAVLDRIEVAFNQSTANEGKEYVIYASDKPADLQAIKNHITSVTAYYSDGVTERSEVIDSYTLTGSIATAGTSTLTVSYNGKSTTFNVRVTPLTVTGITATFVQTSRVFTATPLETIKTMLTVKPRYNNGDEGEALSTNEYKIERLGAYEEQYKISSNPVNHNEVTFEGSLAYSKLYFKKHTGTQDDLKTYPEYITDESVDSQGNKVETIYVPVNHGDVASTVDIYRVDREYKITNPSFQPGLLGLFRVTLNINTSLTAEFTANIDSAKLVSISAEWIKTGDVTGPTRTIFTSTPLDDLREWLTVYAFYEDESEGTEDDNTTNIGGVIVKERIIGDYTLSTTTGGLTAGQCSVAVGYNGLIDSIVVPNVQPIQVKTATAVYNQNGKIYESTPLEDLKNMLTITAYNNDGSSKVVPADGYTLEVVKANGSPANSLVSGATCTVEVTLKEMTSVTTQFTIDVETYKIVAISAKELARPANVTIYTSTALDSIKQYIEVTANLEDGSGNTRSEKVVDFQLSGELTAGDSVLLVTYNGKITSCILHGVVAVQATGITAAIDQTAKVYSTTELEDLKSMITVNATYNNGTSGEVADSDYELIGTLESGETCSITVRYTGETSYDVADVYVNVDVEAVVLSRISYEYSQGDNDVVYVTDDIYKLSQWLNVYAHYSIGGVELERQEVGGYTLTGELTAGYIPILITYNGLSTFFNAQITAVSLQGISASYRPTTEVYAATPVDSLKEMIYVEAYYNNGKTEPLAASDYYLSVRTVVDNKTYGYFIAGQVSTVTVTYGRDVNLTDSFLVSVESSQLSYISAEFDSDNAKIYYGKSTVEDLRQYLSVTAHYEEPTYELVVDETGKPIPDADGKDQYQLVIKDKAVVVTGYTLSGVLEKDKENRISVFYSGAVDYFTVTPENVTLTGISVSFKQTERLYESTPVNYLKSMFEVTALYSDGTGVSVAPSDYDIYSLDGGDIAADENKFVLKEIRVNGNPVGYTADVRVRYTENGVTMNSDTTVQIEQFVILGVEAQFVQGDNVFYAISNLDDLRSLITATVSIGIADPYTVDHTEIVNDYFLLTDNDNRFVEGTNTVTLNYNGKEDTFEVYVTPKASIGLVAEFTQITKVFKTTPLFDLKDMLVVRKQYNDGSYEEITDYTLAVVTEGTQTSNVLHVGTNYVNVYYNDNGTQITTMFEVSVEATSLSYITVDYVQTGNIYTSQDLDFLVQWLKVWAHYSDSSTIEIITGYNLVGELYAGTSVITVTYGGKQTTFNATVTEVSLVAMSATLTQTAKVYESTSLDSLKSMLTVNLIYNNGETKVVPDEDYYISGALVAGDNCQMTVVYLKDQSHVAYFYVHVVATVLDHITAVLDEANLPVIYTTSDINILKDYLNVTAHYVVSDNDSSAVETEPVYDYTLTTETGKLVAGKARITVNYNGFTFPISVNVVQTVATKIYVHFDQGDTKIYESTPLDVLKGLLTVDVEFNDGNTSYDVKDYVLERVGQKKVSVTYGTAPAVEFEYELETISISSLEIEIVDGSNKLVVSTSTKLEDIKNLITVTAVFNNGNREVLDADDYTLEGTVAAGSVQLSIRYNGKLAKLDVEFVAPVVTGIRLAEEFVQGYSKIYASTPLENIKKLITVIATYSDGTESEIADYNITGTLVKGQVCRIVVSVGEYNLSFYVQVEDVAVDHIEANPTLPVMTVQMYNTSDVVIHVGDTLEWVKQYLVVRVYPKGTHGVTGDLSKYTLTSTQYELTGDMNKTIKDTVTGQLYVTLTVTYTNTYTLVAEIQVPVLPKA